MATRWPSRQGVSRPVPDLWCSCLGGLIGVGLLMAVALQLARLALKFSSFEYFWLALFGLSMSAVVSAGHTFHGLMAATFGMLLSTIGLDIVSGAQRFTYGQTELMDGVQFIPRRDRIIWVVRS